MANKYLTLEELRTSQISMLQEFHRVCVENNLTYYMAFGTLLGAVRHKGFIPWDDDVDLMMPLEDFERLFKLYQSDRYYLTDCFHDKRHQLWFPRIYDSYTCTGGDDESLGVFIDIYIIHGAPSDHLERVKYTAKVMYQKEILSFCKKWRGRLSRHFFPCLWNKRESIIITVLCKKMYETLLKYNFKESEFVFPYSGDGPTEIYWKDYFEKPILLPFNGNEYCAPIHYHEILSSTYGNYMNLPPEEKRIPYHGSSCFCWKTKIE